MIFRPLLLAALCCLGSAPLRAQDLSETTSSGAGARRDCVYRRCALGIAPIWSGLAVVRGAERSQVANLHFFWPGRIDAAFIGDSALSYASRAVRTRRVAAVLTD